MERKIPSVKRQGFGTANGGFFCNATVQKDLTRPCPADRIVCAVLDVKPIKRREYAYCPVQPVPAPDALENQQDSVKTVILW
jgi:hypothetical protein